MNRISIGLVSYLPARRFSAHLFVLAEWPTVGLASCLLPGISFEDKKICKLQMLPGIPLNIIADCPGNS